MANYGMFNPGMSFGGGSSNFFSQLGDIGMNAWAGFNNGMDAHSKYMDWQTKANTHNNAMNAANANLIAHEANDLYIQQMRNGQLAELGRLQAVKTPGYNEMIMQMMGAQGSVNNPQSTTNTQGTSVNTYQTMAHTPAGVLANPAPNTTGFTVQQTPMSLSNTEYLQKFGGY